MTLCADEWNSVPLLGEWRGPSWSYTWASSHRAQELWRYCRNHCPVPAGRFVFLSRIFYIYLQFLLTVWLSHKELALLSVCNVLCLSCVRLYVAGSSDLVHKLSTTTVAGHVIFTPNGLVHYGSQCSATKSTVTDKRITTWFWNLVEILSLQTNIIIEDLQSWQVRYISVSLYVV